MDEQLLRSILIRFEGNKPNVYADSLGNKTVGVGHLDNSMILGQVVSPSMLLLFYKQDTANALIMAKKAVGLTCFNSLDEYRQINLIQLCFNMGSRILQFHKMILALQNHDYQTAASELQNSKWYTEVGERGPSSVHCFLTGSFD